MTSTTWLDEDTDGESLDENAARGGFLSEAGRAAAIRAALGLVGRYFQKRGRSDQLTQAPALSLGREQKPIDERLMAGLRLRSALASVTRLLPLLEDVGRRPTFRYTLNHRDSVGELRGTLDIGRFTTRPPVSGGPPTYPILDVYRSADTPENVMCAVVVLWTTQELRQSVERSDATPESPESVAAAYYIERLTILLTIPAFREGAKTAQSILQRDTVDRLLERVEERLRRGEVGNPEPYARLLDEIRDLQHHGPTGAAGNHLWSFYDYTFDTRLYELWCLYKVAQVVSEALAVEMPSVQPNWNGGGLTFQWRRPVGVLELYYQRSLTTVSEASAPQWVRSTGATLRGIPDLIARAESPTGNERFALLDAKLRQRSGPPVEELYKILGYFNNFGVDSAPQGAILHHAPLQNTPLVYRYENASNSGVLIATALNPSNEAQSSRGLEPIAEMIVGLLGLPPSSAGSTRQMSGVGDLVTAERLAELMAIAATLEPATLNASKRRLRATLGDRCWNLLPDEVQTMMATADHVGFNIDDESDFSGPILGLLVPLDVLLNSLIIKPAQTTVPNAHGLHRVTFGAAIAMLSNAVDNSKGAISEAIRTVLDYSGASYSEIRATMVTLADLNIKYRVPAAHKGALTKDHWIDVHNLVVLGRKQGEVSTGRALIGHLVDQLSPHQSSGSRSHSLSESQVPGMATDLDEKSARVFPSADVD